LSPRFVLPQIYQTKKPPATKACGDSQNLKGVAMTKAGHKRLVRLHKLLDNGCWLDIYEGPWFTGKLRRLRGPGHVQDPHHKGRVPGSVIVGPNARVARHDLERCAALQPRQIVPEFAKQPFARKLKSVHLLAADVT
jgi:hypothetical protein